MAGKFRIFCDDCPTTFEPEDKPMVLGSQSQLPTANNNKTSATNDSNNQLAAAAAAAKLASLAGHHNNPADQQDKLSERQPLAAATSSGTSGLAILANASHNINKPKLPLGGAGGGAAQPLKREPLGLRQPLTHHQPQQQAPVSTDAYTGTTSSSSGLSINEEDQENDISMASLGSDFVPSILHDDDEFGDNSFEVEEEEEEDDEAEGEITHYDYEDDVNLYEDDDFEDDEELRMEISQAFKQHDDSQLFKSSMYIDDIESYLQNLERKPELRALPNYMDFQSEIDTNKRAILINWLVEVSDEYELQTETLFICTSIIDRFLSKMCIPVQNFQLLGVAAMFIASKYEEIYPPNLHQFVEVTDDTYSGQQIRQMEQEILKTLNFRISLPTITFFLRQIFAFNKFSKKVYHLAEYLCYLSLLDDKPTLEYYPSEIALAAVILAANQLDASANISTELRAAYDRSNIDQLRRRDFPKGVSSSDADRRLYIVNKDLPLCIEALRALQERSFSRPSKNPSDTTIVHRFSTSAHSNVALLPAPKVEDLLQY